MSENKKETMILTIIAVSSLLIVVFGATYAYFQIIATSNVTGTNMQGSTETMPKGALVTNITELKINLDAKLMSEGNKGTTYYATPSGTPVTSATEGSGKYVLATASLDKSGLTYDCVYSYKISATRTKAINDGSDADVKVRITGSDGSTQTYTLAELLSGNQTYSGNIKGLTYGTNQKIYIEAYVENTSSKQDDLAGNSFSFKIELVENSFKCGLPKTAAEKLIASGELWQSTLEGDGYRYIGSGSYDSATTPDNFICFGTTDKATCKKNESKYMYRIIGVFEGSDGKQHLKLISLKQLGTYAWNSDNSTDVAWENSDLYKGLNGSYFLTNTTYDYMQNSTWLNKIENWAWNAVNTLSCGADGNCEEVTSGPDYYNITTEEMYLHEMNRTKPISVCRSNWPSGGCDFSIGQWTMPIAKIGLMYASDYQMSLGSSALSYTGSANSATLKTGWLHQSNNDTTADTYEWTISRSGDSINGLIAWGVASNGHVNDLNVNYTRGVRLVFHLTSDVKISAGSGTYSDPYFINE